MLFLPFTLLLLNVVSMMVDSKDSNASVLSKKDKRLGDVFKAMMGFVADATGNIIITENDKVEASKNRWSDARFAMAHSCYNCVMDTTTAFVEATCKTAAIAAFKSAFDDDFASVAKKPSDVMIKALFKSSATEYTTK